jgi:hypothetical protein
MNYKLDIALLDITKNQVTTHPKLWLWLKKFWQFSCYYSDYRVNTYLKQK